MNIGEKIKTIRLTKNLTQQFVANAIGVSVTGYGDIERGNTKDITITRLEQIAKVLDVSPGELLEEKHDKHNNHNNHNTSSNTDLMRLQQEIIENYKTAMEQKEKETEYFKQLLSRANKELKKLKK